MPRDNFNSFEPRNPEPRRARAAGGFVPLTGKVGSAGARKMPDSLSAHSIRGRLKDDGFSRGGQGVLNDLVEELNEGICPEDEYSMRSVLRTLHSDVTTGKQAIDFQVFKDQIREAIDRLKETLPEKKEKSRRSARRQGSPRAARSHQRPRRRS